MFIIAGITPKTTVLDAASKRCPACGLFQARLKRTDSYLSLFFIPLFRVRTGKPFVHCERCGQVAPQAASADLSRPEPQGIHCKTCGRTLERHFSYCPDCGAKT